MTHPSQQFPAYQESQEEDGIQKSAFHGIKKTEEAVTYKQLAGMDVRGSFHQQ
jgi:hypothetical protein